MVSRLIDEAKRPILDRQHARDRRQRAVEFLDENVLIRPAGKADGVDVGHAFALRREAWRFRPAAAPAAPARLRDVSARRLLAAGCPRRGAHTEIPTNWRCGYRSRARQIPEHAAPARWRQTAPPIARQLGRRRRSRDCASRLRITHIMAPIHQTIFDGEDRSGRGRAGPRSLQRGGRREQRRAELDRRRRDVRDDRENEHRRERGGASGRTHEQSRDGKLEREPRHDRIETIRIEARRRAGGSVLQAPREPAASTAVQPSRLGNPTSCSSRVVRQTAARAASLKTDHTLHILRAESPKAVSPQSRISTLYQGTYCRPPLAIRGCL